MKASRITEEYENGVKDFLQFTEHNAPSLRGKFFCPCVNCENGRHQSLKDIGSHLICHEIIPNYTKWIWQRKFPDMPTISHAKPVNVDIGHHIEDMICDLGQHDFEQAHAPLYDKIENDSKKGSVFGVHSFHKVVNGVSFGQFEGTIWVE